MPIIKDLKVYYPTKEALPPAEIQNIWYEYLLTGLSKVGYVQLDYSLDKINAEAYSQGITIFEIEIAGRQQRVFYDWSDKIFNPDSVAKEIPYFKIQCSLDSKAVIPIGQTVMLMEYYNSLTTLRNLREQKSYTHDIIGIFKASNMGTRFRAVELIKQQNWKSFVGLHPYSALTKIPRELEQYRLEYTEHLRAQCRSKLSLVLCGLYDEGGFSWRLTEALGLGCAVITHKHQAAYPAHRIFEKECVITVEPDLSDLQAKVDYYLTHNTERERIAQNGRSYFDKYLTPEAMAKRLVSVIRSRK